MSFTPHQIKERYEDQCRTLDRYQRKALLGMLGMVLLTFLASNMWAILWQGSDWLVATVLPATVVDLTNSERNRLAAAPLQRNETLDRAATLKAQHMAKNGYFAHYSPDGVTPWHWFGEVDYSFVHAGENLAVHFNDSKSLVQAWMDSTTHRDNIVNGQFTEIGVGTARGRYQGYETTFVVQLFGTPAAPAPARAELAADTPAETESETVAVAPSESVATETVDDEESTEDDSVQAVAVAGESSPEESSVAAGDPAPTPAPADQPTHSATAPAETSTDSEPTQTGATNQVVAELDMEEADMVTAFQAALREVDNPQSHSVAGATRPVWQTGTHTTSTDKTVATSAVAARTGGSQAGILAYATQPQTVMQFLYTILSFGVLAMLVWALRLEARRHQFVQMSYSFGLIVLMGGLWYVHVTVTSGVIIA